MVFICISFLRYRVLLFVIKKKKTIFIFFMYLPNYLNAFYFIFLVFIRLCIINLYFLKYVNENYCFLLVVHCEKIILIFF